MTPNLTATTGGTTVTAAEIETSTEQVARRVARATHPAGRGSGRSDVAPATFPADHGHDRGVVRADAGAIRPFGEDGSLVTEYGLLAVVAATVAGVVIQWASGGALVTLFNALLRHARSLVGA